MKNWKEIHSQQQTKKIRKVSVNMIRKKEIDKKRPQLDRFYSSSKIYRRTPDAYWGFLV